MRHRRVFLSVCLFVTAFGAEAVAQTLGRPPAPAARMHDMSYGSWTDLPDAWGYFPPSGIADRQWMLVWADTIRRDAAILERSLIARERPKPKPNSDGIEAVRAVRYQAERLSQELLFGSHMAGLKPRLAALAAALDASSLRESADPQVLRWIEKGDRDLESIVRNSGPWPNEPLVSRRRGLDFQAPRSGGNGQAAADVSAGASSRP